MKKCLIVILFLVFLGTTAFESTNAYGAVRRHYSRARHYRTTHTTRRRQAKYIGGGALAGAGVGALAGGGKGAAIGAGAGALGGYVVERKTRHHRTVQARHRRYRRYNQSRRTAEIVPPHLSAARAA